MRNQDQATAQLEMEGGWAVLYPGRPFLIKQLKCITGEERREQLRLFFVSMDPPEVVYNTSYRLHV